MMQKNDHPSNHAAVPADRISIARHPWLRPIGWFSTVVFTLFAGVFAWLVLDKIEAQSRRNIAGILTAVLNTSEEAMRHLVVKYKEDAESSASSDDVLENVMILLREPHNRASLLASPAQKRLRDLLRPMLKKRGYIGIFVIAPDYISLASMRDSNVGSTNLLAEQGDFLARVFAGQTLLSRPMYSDVPLPDATGELVEGQPTMFAAAPVRDAHGTVIAALTFRIVPARDFSRIARLGRIGETGDTYGFDRSGKLLTESLFHEQLKEIGLLEPGQHELLTLEIRDPGSNMAEGFRPQTPRSEQPLTRMATAAVAGTTGVDVDGYRDYRGVEVVGAWTWDDELRFAMATEMNYAEAYGPYHNTRWLLLLGLSLIVVMFVSLSTILSTGRSRALHLAEQMTRALRDSEQRYRSLIQTAGNVIVYLSPEHRILEFNDEAVRVHAASREEVLGEDYYDRFVPEVSRELFATAERSLPGDPTSGSFESPVRAADDTQPLVLWNLTRLLDDEGGTLGIIAVGQDITELKRAEDRALLAERLAAIGQVSTGLAHESRNALARSQGCLEMLARRVENQPDAIDLIDRIQAAQRQLLRLYEHVREYAAPITLDRRPLSLNDILYQAWDHLESERVGRDIRIHVEADGVDLVCEVDPFRVEQVVRNILENAINSYEDSGTITIAFSEAELNGAAAVLMTVANDGPPLTPEERERIFEAFFSGKTRGTGLGKAITRRIVEAHGGRIAVGQPPHGVEIVVTLPRSPS